MDRTVMMTVPLSLVHRVADLLDEHDAREVAVIAADPATERVFVPQMGAWTEAEVHELAGAIEEKDYHLILDLLDHAAAEAGEWVLAPDKRATSPYHVRNQLSALTKLMVKTFDGREYWPMQHKRGDDGASYYRLQTEVATWWRSAREAGA